MASLGINFVENLSASLEAGINLPVRSNNIISSSVIYAILPYYILIIAKATTKKIGTVPFGDRPYF